MHIGLGIRMSGNRGAGGGFSPNALFASSEAGDWFDPSDLSLMFQDTAGLTPVTTDGQTVGMILGQRQGKTRGAELFSSFNTIMSPWTGSGLGPFSIDGSHGGNADLIIDPFTLTVGKLYEFTFTISGASGNFLPFLGRSSAQAFGNGTHVVKNVCNANYIYFRAPAGIAGTVTGFSVREIPGTHLIQSDAAKRPVYAFAPLTGRRNLLTKTEDLSDAAWVKSGGSATAGSFTASSATARVYQPATVISGQSYTYQVKAKSTTSNFIAIRAVGFDTQPGIWFDISTGAMGTAQSGMSGSISGPDGDGFYTCVATFSGTTTDLVGDFSIYLANDDSFLGTTAGNSVELKQPQLEVGSTATAYQKVNTAFGVTEAGVPTIHWLQFDGTNDGLSSAATLDLSGTGVVTLCGGAKSGPASDRTIVENGFNSMSAAFGVAVAVSPTASYEFFAASRGNVAAVLSVGAGAGNPPVNAQNNNVFFSIQDIPGDLSTLRVNGVDYTSSTADKGTGNHGNRTIHVGYRQASSNFFNGNIYFLLIRGALTSGADLTALEGFAAAKTGITL
jgi:hypothetical protein